MALSRPAPPEAGRRQVGEGARASSEAWSAGRGDAWARRGGRGKARASLSIWHPLGGISGVKKGTFSGLAAATELGTARENSQNSARRFRFRRYAQQAQENFLSDDRPSSLIAPVFSVRQL